MNVKSTPTRITKLGLDIRALFAYSRYIPRNINTFHALSYFSCVKPVDLHSYPSRWLHLYRDYLTIYPAWMVRLWRLWVRDYWNLLGIRPIPTKNTTKTCQWFTGCTTLPSYLRGPLLPTWFNSIPAWISNHMPSVMCDEITHPFPKLQRLHHWSLGMDD